MTSYLTITLTNGISSRYFRGDLDVFWRMQIALGDLFDRRRHGRGEQGGLFLLWCVAQDQFHIINKAHTEHFIRFVQN